MRHDIFISLMQRASLCFVIAFGFLADQHSPCTHLYLLSELPVMAATDFTTVAINNIVITHLRFLCFTYFCPVIRKQQHELAIFSPLNNLKKEGKNTSQPFPSRPLDQFPWCTTAELSTTGMCMKAFNHSHEGSSAWRECIRRKRREENGVRTKSRQRRTFLHPPVGPSSQVRNRTKPKCWGAAWIEEGE